MPWPPKDDWSVPLRCFRMEGDQKVLDGSWDLGRRPTGDPTDLSWLEAPPLEDSLVKAAQAMEEAEDILVNEGFSYIREIRLS